MGASICRRAGRQSLARLRPLISWTHFCEGRREPLQDEVETDQWSVRRSSSSGVQCVAQGGNGGDWVFESAIRSTSLIVVLGQAIFERSFVRCMHGKRFSSRADLFTISRNKDLVRVCKRVRSKWLSEVETRSKPEASVGSTYAYSPTRRSWEGCGTGSAAGSPGRCCNSETRPRPANDAARLLVLLLLHANLQAQVQVVVCWPAHSNAAVTRESPHAVLRIVILMWKAD